MCAQWKQQQTSEHSLPQFLPRPMMCLQSLWEGFQRGGLNLRQRLVGHAEPFDPDATLSRCGGNEFARPRGVAFDLPPDQITFAQAKQFGRRCQGRVGVIGIVRVVWVRTWRWIMVFFFSFFDFLYFVLCFPHLFWVQYSGAIICAEKNCWIFFKMFA